MFYAAIAHEPTHIRGLCAVCAFDVGADIIRPRYDDANGYDETVEKEDSP